MTADRPDRPDRLLDIVARRQHGVFTRDQGRACGLSDEAIARRIAGGAWIRLAPGVYAIASGVLSTHRQYKAAQLSVAGAGIAQLAAAHLQELAGFRTVRPEIVVPMGCTSRSRIARVHRAVIPARLTTVRGIRVTTIAQTIADLTGRRGIDELKLEHALDDAVLTGRLKVSQLVERLHAYDGARRRGTVLLRTLTDERTSDGYRPTESELELRLLKLVGKVPGLGEVVVQPQFSWRAQRDDRVDFLLPSVGALLEADGRRWHARMAAFDDDRERDNEAVLHGLRPLRFTWRHLTASEPMVLDQLSRLQVSAAS